MRNGTDEEIRRDGCLVCGDDDIVALSCEKGVSGDLYDDEVRIILTDSNVENLSLIWDNRNEIHRHNSHSMTID